MVLRQQRAGRADAGGDHVENAPVEIVGNLLRQPRHRHAGLPDHLASVRRNRSVEQLEHGALACAVSSQQADAFAAFYRELRAVE